MCAGEDLPLQGRTFRLEETLGAVCVNGELAVLRKTTGPEVDRCLTPGAASIALAPLEWDGQVRGVLGVRSSSLDAFDEAGVEEVRTLTAGASIALRNAELIAKLAASERSYRELHDRAADAILVFDSNSVIVDANEAAATLLLRSVEELRGLQAQELFTTVELAAAPLRTDELMRTGELRSERPFLRKDGTEIMVEYSCRVLDGGRVHASLRDVTQRRRNEDRLRTSLGRLHAIVQTQQQIAALELDHEALTSTIVLRAQRLCGGDGAAVQWFEGHESVYHHCSGIAAGHVGLRLDRSASLAGLASLNDEAIYSSDTSIDPRADGDVCARLGIRSLICAPLHRDGTVVGVLSILGREPHAFDELAVETARLMAEFIGAVLRNTNELQERGALLEQLRLQDQVVEHMQTALYVFAAGDRSLRLRFANKATEEATGLPIAEVMGRPLREIFPNVPPASDRPPAAGRRDGRGARRRADRVRRRPDRAEHLLDQSLPAARRRSRRDVRQRDRRRAHRGPAAAGAEDGSGRPARRRHRPRLQQPAHGDLRVQRVPDRRNARPEAAPVRGGDQARRPTAPPRSPASCSRSAAGRCCSRGSST